MFPEQQNQPGQSYPPSQPPVARPQPTPPAVPQQAPNGAYTVVPPLPAGQNNGHSGHNPYEFIVTPNTPKHSGKLLGGNAFLAKIGLLVGGAIVIMIMAAVLLNALVPNKGGTAELTTIAQQQQELIRVATIGSEQAQGQAAQNFAASVQYGLTSDQNQLLQYLAGQGKKVGTKTLALKQNSKTDQLLADAASAGNFDTVFTQTVTDQLATYQKTLETTYKATSGKNAKALLQSEYSAAGTLITTAPRTD
jgi:hypothetical protein